MINTHLFTLEGTEGSGKSSQMAAIKGFIESKGLKAIITRQPGGTEIGGKIRKILLDPESKALVPKAEALLYLADRAQHIEETIIPNTEKGIYVICDRFHDSTLAYQNAGRGLHKTGFAGVIESIYEGLGCMPIRTYLLDLEPELGLKRAWKSIKETGDTQTRFEQEALDFHRKVRGEFLKIAEEEPERVYVVDASRPMEEVSRFIISDIARYIL